MAAGTSRRHIADDDLDLDHELKVHIDTLRELGPEYTDDVANAFLDKVDRLIDERVEERLAGRGVGLDRHVHAHHLHAQQRMAHGRRMERAGEQRHGGPVILIPMMALGIPLTAIAGGTAGALGIIVVWGAILLLGFVWMSQHQR